MKRVRAFGKYYFSELNRFCMHEEREKHFYRGIRLSFLKLKDSFGQTLSSFKMFRTLVKLAGFQDRTSSRG